MTATAPLRAFVVDDEPLALKRLSRMLTATGRVEIVGQATDPGKALPLISTQPVDVLFLDIHMPGLNGFQVVERVPAGPLVVFTTAYDQHAVRAFEVNAIDYLLKPVRLERLLAALGKTRAGPPVTRAALDAAANLPRRHLSVHERGKISLVPLADILYLRAELKYVTVRTAEREYLVEESLTHLEEEFADTFVRVHRNCLVARPAIGGFERSAEDGESGWAVVIKATGERLPVSRRQHHVVKQFR
jgi:two-component system response regulator AlgR